MQTQSLTVKQAAQILGKSEQFIRIGIQRGILPIGSAVKLSTQWTYYISEAKLYDYVGYRKEKFGDDCAKNSKAG